MTTVDEARRRPTDEMLDTAMGEAGNGDPKKVASGGRPLHYDSFRGLEGHRVGQRPSDRDGAAEIGMAALGKLVGAGADAAVNGGVAAMATSAAARGASGACWQATTTAVLAYHLYTEGYEKPHREKDLQLALGANDAGVVGLAQALPFDEDFKRAVTTAHAGSSNAAAAVATNLTKPEHRPELDELTLRSERGLVDAAPLARGASHGIAACLRGASSLREQATAARARGDGVYAADCEERASTALAHAAELEKAALAPIMARAHGDATYGLGVQSAMHHAVRVELGKEPLEHLGASVATARAHLLAADPPALPVKG